VRFEGFGADEDEWVNVKKCIRERSIPLESSQCRSIVEGDLVLCFRVSGLLEKKRNYFAGVQKHHKTWYSDSIRLCAMPGFLLFSP